MPKPFLRNIRQQDQATNDHPVMGSEQGQCLTKIKTSILDMKAGF